LISPQIKNPWDERLHAQRLSSSASTPTGTGRPAARDREAGGWGRGVAGPEGEASVDEGARRAGRPADRQRADVRVSEEQPSKI